MRNLLTGLLLIAFVTVAAGEEPAEKARRLRDEANAENEAERYEEAVRKFKEAERLFAEAGEKYVSDRAILLRAICWNLKLAGKAAETRAAWFRLAELTVGKEALAGHAFSGYVAVLEVSAGQPDIDARLTFLEPVRGEALRIGHPKIAAQVLHDMAFHLAGADLYARAVPLLVTAIAERRKIQDMKGLSWSLNNLANAHLELGNLDAALPLVLEAFQLVHEKDIRAAQLNVAARVRSVLTQIGEAAKLTTKMKKFLWDIAFTSARAMGECFIPPDYLVRVAMAADPNARMLGQVGRLTLDGLPDEVRADVQLSVARAYLDAGKGSNATRLLRNLSIGEGPAAAHLAARLATMNALLAADGKKKKAFPDLARAAAKAWRDLGDTEGQKDALKRLAEAIRALEMDADLVEIVSEYKRLASRGQPGGKGGFAMSSGDRSKIGSIGARDPLFEIRMTDGKIVVTDLLAGATHTQAVEWIPRGIAINGLSITFFGGYVRIDNLNYNGAATAGGTPGSISLAAFGEYLPAPNGGRIVILKNGAHRYE